MKKWKFWLFIGWIVIIATATKAQVTPVIKPRVLISTDIGGTDPDDNQSMVHLLMNSDRMDIEGLVSSPSYGNGSKAELLRMIDLYEQDFHRLHARIDDLMTPAELRTLCKQGHKGAAPIQGFDKATEGSEWIVRCARQESDRPLWVLVWGGLEDVAQALHDAPDIVSRIRVYWIGGPNKKWSVNSYLYIVEHHPDLWMIENNASYRGFISDGKRNDNYNAHYYCRFIEGAGAMGADFKNYYGGLPKMGDTPSVLYVMEGDADDPTGESWGGSFEPMPYSPRTVFKRHTTERDTVAPYTIIEWRFKGPRLKDTPQGTPCLTLTIDKQEWDGYYMGKGEYIVRYAPKAPGRLPYTLHPKLPGGLPQGEGTIVVSEVWPGKQTPDSYQLGENWYTDKRDPALFQKKWQGAKTVSRQRKRVLNDWADRWSWIKGGNYELDKDMPIYLNKLKREMTFPMAWGTDEEKEFDQWKHKARETVKEAMMTPPTPAKEWDMKVIDVEQRNGYEARKIEFNISDYARIPAYLLVPTNTQAPKPAIITLHDHGAHFTIGKEKMVRPFGVDSLILADADKWAHGCYDDQYAGDYLASRGYVVLAIDALFWGERGRREGADYEGQQSVACVFEMLGRSWSGTTTYEDAYCAEFLASLPEVDANRIGCMGFSMGGYRSWMLSAISDRIKVGAAICWMVTTDYQLHWRYRGGKGGSDFANTLPGLRRYLDYPHVASLACPKPMLFFNGKKDKLFPPVSVEKAYAIMKQVWESQNSEENLVTRLWDVHHFCNKEIQCEVADFFDKHL